MKHAFENLKRLDATIEPMLHAARIPGAAIAVVGRGGTSFAQGYGYRDLQAKLPMTAETVYPIASTTKAFNATLLGMLVDEGTLAWDQPVQRYIPRARLRDPIVSAQVTLRDLVTMRTGLPRHDWMWLERPISRAALVEALWHLESSSGFRECFQYNNLTTTAAGHVAEVVTGKSWEELIQQRILTPLGMSNTTFVLPESGELALSYHENSDRELFLTQRFAVELTAPAGATIYSTVNDMVQWIMFNLNGGEHEGRALVKAETLAEIQTPQVVARTDPACPSPRAAYAMGWFVDTYNGHSRISHGGYHHDVHSSVMLFPDDAVGCVCFTNFGGPRLAGLLNQSAFDCIMNLEPAQALEEVLSQYRAKLDLNHQRIASARRAANTAPSHSLDDYAGTYVHAAYGTVEIIRSDEELVFRRNCLRMPLRHWHYDAWVVRDSERSPINLPLAFDLSTRFLFETDADGRIASLSIRLEPAVAPIRFEKH